MAQQPSIILVTLFLFFSLGLWIGPRVPENDRWTYCVSNVEINNIFGQSLSCDTLGFVWAANDLSLVFGKKSGRQDRPGSPLLAYVLSQPLFWNLNKTVHNDEIVELEWKDGSKTNKDRMKKTDFLARYFGFIIMNLFILYTATSLYFRAIGIHQHKEKTKEIFVGSSFLLSAFILINNVTKLFLWSAHTQLFSLLSAVASVYFFKAIQSTDKPEKIYFCSALACGIGMLFYGIFVIPITIIGLGYLWRNRNILSTGGNLISHFLFRNLLAVLIFALPYALWYAFILHLNGAFYSYDTETFRGFFWLNDLAANKGWDAAALAVSNNFLAMLYGALIQGWGVLALLWLTVTFAMKKNISLTEAKPLFLGAALYIFLTSIFFAYYGITPLRISYSLITALVPCLGFVIYRIEQKIENPRKLFWATTLGLFCYTVFTLVKFGPYS